MNNITGFFSYLIKIVLSFLCALLMCMICGTKSSVIDSYVMCVFAFSVATFVLSYLFFGISGVTKVVMLAYFLKIIIGLIHYLVFFDSDYFTSSGLVIFHNNLEYSNVYEAICSIANDKSVYGLFYTDLHSVFATHPEMLHLISIPFVYFGNYILTISPINAFFSSFICVSWVILAKEYLGMDKKKQQFLLYITAFFPMFIVSSYWARDIVGISLMSIGITMFLLSKSIILKCISLVCALYLFYMHRTLYPIILLLALVLSPIVGHGSKNFRQNIIFSILILYGMSYASEIFLPFIFTDVNTSMYNDTIEMSYGGFFIKFVLLFIGPLWRQINTAPEYSYALWETFAVIIMDAGILSFIKSKNDFSFDKINTLAILGFFLFLVGAFNSSGHIPYVVVGIIFLLPFLVDSCSIKLFTKNLKLVVVPIIVLNILSLFFQFGIF